MRNDVRLPELPGFSRDDSRIVIEGPETFKVRTEGYTANDVFERECKRIFEKTWIFVAHESEIPNAGDYKSTYIGTQPVIVVRGDAGEVYVMVNRCVHRGSVVCREQTGNATTFTCPYHSWSYKKDGTLIGIPLHHEDGGYSDNFEMPAGLAHVPRVDRYRGLIFANFDPEAQPLLDFLGRAKLFIDRKFGRSPAGEVVLASKPYVVVYKGNWKFQSENIIDGYHFLFVHQGFVKLQEKYGDTTGDFGVHKGGSQSEMRKIRSAGNLTLGCPQGHGLSEVPSPSVEAMLTGPYADYYQQLLDQHGAEELPWVLGGGSSCMFPNLGIIHHQIRTWRPIGPALTEVTIYPFELKGAPDEVNEGWLRSQERFYGPAGYGMTDDVEVFALNQQGLAGTSVPWVILERGMHTDTVDEDGIYHGKAMGETQIRAFWRRWSQLMEQD